MDQRSKENEKMTNEFRVRKSLFGNKSILQNWDSDLSRWVDVKYNMSPRSFYSNADLINLRIELTEVETRLEYEERRNSNIDKGTK